MNRQTAANRTDLNRIIVKNKALIFRSRRLTRLLLPALFGMAKTALKLAVSRELYSIHRFEPDSPIPNEILSSGVFFIGKTDEELSLVCRSDLQVDSPKSVSGWSYIKVVGPLDFNLQGVLSRISNVLADAGISICAISTFDTDYIFVRIADLDNAESALEKAGYIFE